MFAFQSGTRLIGVDRSHISDSREYQPGDGVASDIPTGWGLVWNGLYVHGGDGCCDPWHSRYHMYLRVKGVSHSATGMIDFAEAN